MAADPEPRAGPNPEEETLTNALRAQLAPLFGNRLNITSGLRTQAQQEWLARHGYGAALHDSAHLTPGGAFDIVVNGMAPGQIEAAMQAAGMGGYYLPEGGAHSHLHYQPHGRGGASQLAAATIPASSGDPLLDQVLGRYAAIRGATGGTPEMQAISREEGNVSAASRDAEAAMRAEEPEIAGVQRRLEAENANGLPTPHYQNNPETPAVAQPHPMQVFGQMLPVMAMLGAAFTKGGAINALNVASEAMKGSTQGTLDLHSDQVAKWEEEVRNVATVNQNAARELQDAFERKKDNVDELMSELKVISAKYQLPMLREQLAQGRLDMVYNHAQMLNTTTDKILGSLDAMDVKREALTEARLRSPPVTQAYVDGKERALAAGKTPEEAERDGEEAARKAALAVKPGFEQQIGQREERLMNTDQRVVAYRNNARYIQSMEEFTQNPGELHNNGPEQTRLLDAFTRLATNQAIREFMVNSATKYQGLMDTGSLAAARAVLNRDGYLSDQQIKQYLDASASMARELKSTLGNALKGHAQHMQDRGIDPGIAMGGDDLDAAIAAGFQPAPSRWTVSDPNDTSAQPQSTQAAPQAGTVVSGYRFKGGDPNDQKNWEKVSG